MNKIIRVLVVDDSAVIRHLLTEIIDRNADMKVVGAASDPIIAREMIRNLNPDVLTLDVEMPRMDGLDFLERLMRLRPMPVVMVSTLTEFGSEVTLRALELGAIDFVAKPKTDVHGGLEDYADIIADKIRAASISKIQRAPEKTKSLEKFSADAILPAFQRTFGSPLEGVIVIGASTGGTEAIREVLMKLPPSAPGILITQHMPQGFTRTFADRLNRLCHVAVKEAENREVVLPGHAYVAPGGECHMLLKRNAGKYVIELNPGVPVNRHRPSVDVLFRSAAQCAQGKGVGVILTGMGNDGARGMKEMHDAGLYTIAQDQETCVVFGMPKEAIATGGVDEVRPLGMIAGRIMAAVERHGSHK